MIEVIKNLKPGQRLQAFIFAAVLSSGTAILTSYMKTDDCKALSDQYEVLIKNHAELMKINNELLADNNYKQENLLKVKNIIAGINTSQKSTSTELQVKESNYPVNSIVKDTSMGEVAMDQPAPKTVLKKIERVKIIREVPKEQKVAIDSALKIIDASTKH